MIRIQLIYIDLDLDLDENLGFWSRRNVDIDPYPAEKIGKDLDSAESRTGSRILIIV